MATGAAAKVGAVVAVADAVGPSELEPIVADPDPTLLCKDLRIAC